MEIDLLKELCRLIRYDIVTSTTKAGSGHPTSSLSAVELMATLFFSGFYRYDLGHPRALSNDRVIFSKGHASPLLYSLYHAAGAISTEELMSLRQFDSVLEGHPTPRFKFVDVATGALGQGLSVGFGMALGIKTKLEKSGIKRIPKVWVLLGDSEMAEGQIWEAMNTASYYKLNNLIGILDVNRLGQTGETMYGWNLKKYEDRAGAFGWEPIVLEDGHNLEAIEEAFKKIDAQKPTLIIAKTVKGKGVSFLEDKEGWHGKAIPKEKLPKALKEIGEVDLTVRGTIVKPEVINLPSTDSNLFQINAKLDAIVNGKKMPANQHSGMPEYQPNDLVATREAFGDALITLGKKDPSIVALDAETSNSTFMNKFEEAFPERFFQMFIAEQHMVSAALGMSKVGFAPFLSTFAAFLTRAFDQIRMAQYSQPNMKIIGSHVGVSIGQDGPSQMGLEDISLFKSISESIIFYPADAISAYKLVELMSENGIYYLRTTRQRTPILYKNDDKFTTGGSKVLHESSTDVAVVFAAGITLHEALKSYVNLHRTGINIAVVDLYSIKPMDVETINRLSQQSKNVIVVEDHYAYDGIGESVKMALKDTGINFIHLAVKKIPHSGKPEELLRYEQIDADTIIHAVKNFQSVD